MFRAGRLRLLVLACASLRAADTPADIEFFEKKIRPVLATQCYVCHSASAAVVQSGFRADSREGLRKGGNSGQPAVVPGEPGKSHLLAVLKGTPKLKMPPANPLAAEQIADFEAWIKMGAPDPREGAAAVAAQSYNFEEARKFWSFQPVKDPTPPAVKHPAWNKTAIDRFIRAKLAEKRLTPLLAADRRTLIRRATFDLTGLPPSPEEIDGFLADRSAGAFEKVVDRLLASPHYGERWGRHWLDVVRYADTSGCNSDYPISAAYRYRDWVIRSVNQDKPYDIFLREQIAGDLLPSKNEEERYEKIVATGYIATARRFGSRNNEFHLTIEDTIDNVGKAMLGLSVSCARCHDHKFDPVPTRDYYALYGIFDSTRYAFPGTEIYPHAKDFVVLAAGRDAARFKIHQEETSKLDDTIEDFTAGRLGKELSPEDKRKEMQRLRERVTFLDSRFPDVPKAYAVSEGPSPHHARIQRGGDPKTLGDEAPRGFLQILGGQTLPAGASGSGRMELAGWVTDPANPLTARVMVNRIWQRHFGKGVVQSPNDFGARGDRPTHPELLDYLASRFRESGYSVKAMHKLIMLTRAYQMSSGHQARNAELDPKNDFLWRFDRRRLDAEEIRDAILAVGGRLDRSMGGPHPFPPEPTWKYTQHKQFVADYDHDRRSVYLMQQRIRRHPFLELFDGADPNASTARRTATTTSLQALAMMNSSLVHRESDSFAVRIGMAHATTPQRIAYAYQLAFARPATPAEIAEATRFLSAARAGYVDSGLPADQQPRAALASYLRALFASDEFVFLD